MGQTADELRQEIDAKRNDASQKIGQIEEKVTGAADQVKEKVADTADHVKEQVMNTFDWRQQVQERPLVALGAAFLGGVVLAGVVGDGNGKDQRGGYQQGNSNFNIRRHSEQGSGAGSGQGLTASIRNAAKTSGLEETMSGMVGAFMMNLTDRVKTMADQTFPGMADKLQGSSTSGSQGDGLNQTNQAQQTRMTSGASSYGQSVFPAEATSQSSATG